MIVSYFGIVITKRTGYFTCPLLLNRVGYTEDSQQILHGLIYLGVLETVEVDLGDFL